MICFIVLTKAFSSLSFECIVGWVGTQVHQWLFPCLEKSPVLLSVNFFHCSSLLDNNKCYWPSEAKFHATKRAGGWSSIDIIQPMTIKYGAQSLMCTLVCITYDSTHYSLLDDTLETRECTQIYYSNCSLISLPAPDCWTQSLLNTHLVSLLFTGLLLHYAEKSLMLIGYKLSINTRIRIEQYLFLLYL